MKRFLLALLLLAGCYCTYGCASAPIPDQDKAFDIVWHQTYHRSDDGPKVQWETDISCQDSKGVYDGFWGSNWYGGPNNGMCEGGLTWTDLDLCQIALYPPEPNFVFSNSSYAHELNHIRLARETGDGDPNHLDPSWGPGGVVEQANASLKAEGL